MVIAIACVLLSGVTIVLARMCNARLAKLCGIPFSTLLNYITGLTGSLIIFLAAGATVTAAFPAAGASVFLYIGGALGLLSVFIVNNIAHRLPATQLTLLIFLGQLFSGLLLDYFATLRFSPGKLIGGLLVLLGLAVNIRADKKY